MAAASKIVKGTATTDGAGAANATIVTTGYKVRRVRWRNIGLTGGTVTIQDSAGSPVVLLAGSTVSATNQGRSSGIKVPATTVTSPVRVIVSGGGATKQVRYEVELKR